MAHISDYISEDLVLFLDVESRDAALREMVDAIGRAGKLADVEGFYQAILARERVVSTGIGMGVALPHAKMRNIDDFFVAVCLLKKGIDWNALDGGPVRIIFMIGGSDDRQTEYLRILSSLTHVVKDEEERKRLLSAETKAQVVKLFENLEE